MSQIVKERRKEAERKVRAAEQILASAVRVYSKNQSDRVNRIAVKAASRLVKDSKAELEEWTSETEGRI